MGIIPQVKVQCTCTQALGRSNEVHSLTLGEECVIALQLVLDRCLKSLIDSYNKHLHAQKKDVCTAMLTMQERNAIRYMHGWIRCSSVEEKVHQEGHQSIFAKENAIVCEMLEGMQVKNEIEGITSVEDYTKTWIEITDRGGLCKINDKVIFAFCLCVQHHYRFIIQS